MCFSWEPLRNVEKWPEWPFPGATRMRAGPGAQTNQESSLTSFEKGALKPPFDFAWWFVKHFLTFWSELSKNSLLPCKSFLIQSLTEWLKYMGSFLLSNVVRMNQAFWVVVLAFLCYWRIAFKEVRENVISKVSIQKWKEKRKCH